VDEPLESLGEAQGNLIELAAQSGPRLLAALQP
jgi:hypothetical protein